MGSVEDVVRALHKKCGPNYCFSISWKFICSTEIDCSSNLQCSRLPRKLWAWWNKLVLFAFSPILLLLGRTSDVMVKTVIVSFWSPLHSCVDKPELSYKQSKIPTNSQFSWRTKMLPRVSGTQMLCEITSPTLWDMLWDEDKFWNIKVEVFVRNHFKQMALRWAMPHLHNRAIKVRPTYPRSNCKWPVTINILVSRAT